MTTRSVYAILILVVGLCSCSESPVVQPQSTSLSATIDGVQFISTTQTTGKFQNRVFTIAGSDDSARGISLTVANAVTRPYTLGRAGGHPGLVLVVTKGPADAQTFTVDLTTGTGNLNISELTTEHARGTFSAVAENPLSSYACRVANGSFYIRFQP